MKKKYRLTSKVITDDARLMKKGKRYISDNKARAMFLSNQETARKWLKQHYPPYQDAIDDAREALFAKLYTLTPQDVLRIAGRQKNESCYTCIPLGSLMNLSIGRIDPKKPEWSLGNTCLGENRIHLARGNLTLAEWDAMAHRSDRAARKFERPYLRFRSVRVRLGIAPKRKMAGKGKKHSRRLMPHAA